VGRFYLGVDHESFYSSKIGYSLRKIDIPTYLCSPLFENTCCAFKENDKPAFTVDGPDIPKYLAQLPDPKGITVYGHNLLFDASLTSWRYGWTAGMYICTLALSRQTIAKDLRSLSLENVARHLGVGEKGKTIVKVDGMRRADIIAAGLWDEYLGYAGVDIELAYGVMMKLLPLVPPEELVIADEVLRMAIEPSFLLNQPLLEAHLQDVIHQKEVKVAKAMLASGMRDKSELMSNDKFAALLESLGVEPPRKISPVTRKVTYAFAKTDDGMKELLEHDDPVVAAVVAARLGVKSTQDETRTARMLNISRCVYPALGTGWLPVALKVSGAHTHRLSGEWKLNCQNYPRNKPELPPCAAFPEGRPAIKSKLREALCAPLGYLVLTGDESQIEARMTACFSGQWDLVKQFADKLDPYSLMATKMFGRVITKADIGERFCGKTCVLSAQYGVGHKKYRASIKHLAWEQAGIELDLTLEEAEHIINVYRRETPEITRMRKRLDDILGMMAQPGCNIQIGPVHFGYQEITGPTGLKLYYKDLQYAPGVGWIYTYQGRTKYIYGGKLLENIIQFLARCVVMLAMLRLRRPMRELGARRALQAHDELVYVVPEAQIEPAKLLLREELTRRVEWMPALPVACDIGVGINYADAK
jgi:hypothetical protein